MSKKEGLRMNKTLLLGLILLVSFGLFGCTFLQNNSNTAPISTLQQNTSQNQTVSIIVSPQQNQTAQPNETQVLPSDNQSALPMNIPEYTYDPSRPMGVYFLNLGGPALQGNAAVLIKGDFVMLIDAGPVENASTVIDFLHAHNIHRINVFVSTSQDPRNYGGITAISHAFPIQVVWTGDKTDPNYSAVINAVESSDYQNVSVQQGYTNNYDGVKFTILNPSTPRFPDVNNDAVVLRMDDENFSLLYTSNIQTGARDQLLNTQLDLMKVKVMTAPYYGTGTGTSGSNLFLTETMPQTMIITGSSDDSSGNGGSRAPFLRQLTQYGIAAYETYSMGNLVVSTDGINYSVNQSNP